MQEATQVMLDQLMRILLAEMIKAAVWLPFMYLAVKAAVRGK